MSREYLIFSKEVAYGTHPGVSATSVAIQLTAPNAFTVRPIMMPWNIRSASGFNRVIQYGANKQAINGVLNGQVLFGSQMPFWADAFTPTVTAGLYEIPSYSIDHSITSEDATPAQIIRMYNGCKFSGLALTATSDQQVVRMNLGITGQKFATSTAVEPQLTGTAPPPIYPFDTCSTLETSTTFTMGTLGARTEYDQINITINHILDGTFFNSTNITRLRFCGRNASFSALYPVYSANTDRIDFEGVTPHPMAITFHAGSHTLVFNFATKNYTSSVADNIDYDKVFLQTVGVTNTLDGVSQADFTVVGT